MAKSGIYALAALDGGPLDPADLAVLGIHGDADCRAQGDAIMAQALDREEGGRAADVAAHADGFTILLGHLDEAADLADCLAMARDCPPAALAAAAIRTFGAEAPRRMLGEWSLLDWHAPSRTLTVLMSETCRDPLYFAIAGNRIAVSAQISRLTGLRWVGRDLDPTGLLFHWSTARLRRYMTDETMFRRVCRLMPGSREIFRMDGRRTLRLAPADPIEPSRASFAEAMEQIEAVMRRIMRQHLSRYGTVASLLSGGLDSSLLAWLEAAELGCGQPLTFLSSVAPDGSGLEDERPFIKAVADQLGFPVRYVTPAPDANLYIPNDRMFAHSEMPVVSPRHYLYDALYQQAFDEGAQVLFDGAYGELTLTNPFPLQASPLSPRYYIRALRKWRMDMAFRRVAPVLPLHIKPSRAVDERFAQLVPFDWQAPFDPAPMRRRDEPWGIHVAAVKNAMTPTSSPEARLRHVMPYRDRRLLNLVATMPATIMEHGGLDRAPARVILEGRLPDVVRLRKRGLPFSPDYLLRAERQALATAERVDEFRAAGAAEWIDLDWLQAQLKALSVPGAATLYTVQTVQASVAAAAWFVWSASQ